MAQPVEPVRITVVHFARSHFDIIRKTPDSETWRLAGLTSRDNRVRFNGSGFLSAGELAGTEGLIQSRFGPQSQSGSEVIVEAEAIKVELSPQPLGANLGYACRLLAVGRSVTGGE
ncbi:hypothetical protein B0T20DRAFT_475702 [Sordaria brevicollis]|uniref:Uncharacterized protein n=1 Tax=Sordaria brevicollis TaxID=83679 RepID=A0AAE0PKM4_SORBR|nr:hypothetical protein B0T20DRAFT_475702 [Sordaria brevicollis]